MCRLHLKRLIQLYYEVDSLQVSTIVVVFLLCSVQYASMIYAGRQFYLSISLLLLTLKIKMARRQFNISCMKAMHPFVNSQLGKFLCHRCAVTFLIWNVVWFLCALIDS